MLNRWFAIPRTVEVGYVFLISSPAGILTAELTVLFVPLRDIREVIQI
jgi:hypothetical protein